jgi:hypothetical protein
MNKTKLETIKLLNNFIEKLELEINMECEFNVENNLIINTNKILIEQIKNNLLEICSHNWIEDEIYTINGFEKINYCDICFSTLDI